LPGPAPTAGRWAVVSKGCWGGGPAARRRVGAVGGPAPPGGPGAGVGVGPGLTGAPGGGGGTCASTRTRRSAVAELARRRTTATSAAVSLAGAPPQMREPRPASNRASDPRPMEYWDVRPLTRWARRFTVARIQVRNPRSQARRRVRCWGSSSRRTRRSYRRRRWTKGSSLCNRTRGTAASRAPFVWPGAHGCGRRLGHAASRC